MTVAATYGRRPVVLALNANRRATREAVAERLGADPDVRTLSELWSGGVTAPGFQLVVAGSPPEAEIGFGLVPVLTARLRPGSVHLLDLDGGSRARSPRSFALRAAPLASTQLALGAAAIAAQRFVALGTRAPVAVAGPALELQQVVYLRALVGSAGGIGGSITHTHGVIRSLSAAGVAVEAVTTDSGIAAIANAESPPPCEWTLASIPRAFKLLPASAAFGGDVALVRRALRLAHGSDLVYQRHARFSLAGALLSRLARRPLFLEYNGSEDFFRDAWQPTPLARQLAACERAALAAAARIVVVSNVERDRLAERGVDPARVVVNPNAVEPQDFARGGGQQVRRKLGLDSAVVVGFVGSFGPWHGAPVLAEAFSRAARRNSRLRLMLVGDGEEREATTAVLRAGGVADRATLIGEVSPSDVARYLDACDVLASPHVPLPGGVRFFGSPTKLFEYMAAGKAIVASALEQIDDVLEHEHTALLVRPGDADDLAAALERLAESPALRDRLGEAARAEAVANHGWDRNAQRVVEAYRDWAQDGSRPAIQ